MSRQRGFTLIELMIAVAIVAILAAVALPSYSEYIKRGKITDAISALSGMRVKMEQYFQDNRQYTGACTANTVAPKPADTPNFAFTCPTLGGSTYKITATGQGSMAGFTYSINETNTRTSDALPTGWNNSGCGWVIRKDGSC